MEFSKSAARMERRLRKSLQLQALVIALACFCGSVAEGTSDIWATPKTIEYPNFSPDGSFVSAFPIGGFSLGGQTPFNVIFSSAPTRPACYLGFGWRLPIFEATCCKMSEKTYSAELPNGRIVTLNEIGKNRFCSLDSAWEGSVQGDVFTMRLSDSTEVTYEKGYLKSFNLSGKKYEIHKDAYDVSLSEGNKKLFTLNSHGASGSKAITVVDANGKELAAFQLSGMNSANGIIELKSLRANESTLNFEMVYGDSGIPEGIRFDGKRVLWDAKKAGRLVNDGDWAYKINQLTDTVFDVSRNNATNKANDARYINKQTGLEITKDGDLTEERYYFPVGNLAGRTRKLIKKNRNVVISEVFLFYDKDGKFIAKKNGSELIEVKDGFISIKNDSVK